MAVTVKFFLFCFCKIALQVAYSVLHFVPFCSLMEQYASKRDAH